MTRINVSRAFLPPIKDYQAYLEKIWESRQLTNHGPLLREFEKQTANYLRVKHFHFVANGTLALQLALKALDISDGEVITTPFSYVATTSAILWERCEPVYVDIEPNTFCIDPSKIEAAITAETKAIIGVHIFGYPCNVAAIEAIAKKHSLKVIYDAAHAFGVIYKGRSLMSYGDIVAGSFHATKLFHTIEGGCVITKDKTISGKVELTKRFGHNNDDHYMLGINAKASEFHAAMGLCNLKYIDQIINKRKKIIKVYDSRLAGRFARPNLGRDTTYNGAYYPLVLQNNRQFKKVMAALRQADIFPRRYFYPSLNTLPYLRNKYSCPISEDISSRIICLPLYPDLPIEDVERISRIIIKNA